MSIESYLEKVEGGLEKKAVSLWVAMSGYTNKGILALQNFFTVLVPEEITALEPFVTEALGEAADALPTLIAGLLAGNVAGGLTAYAAVLAPVVLATAQKAEAAGLQVAASAVSVAVHAGIANVASAQASPVQ